jgi:hypothetical protein
LPLPYLQVVFTLPAAVAEIAFHNKAAVYAIVFRTAAETLRTIAADPRHLGAEIGLVAVLHSWGQNRHHHPHLHCAVPVGGPSLDGTRWVACRPGLLLPVRVLSRLFRRLFLEALRGAFEASCGLGRARLARPSSRSSRLATILVEGTPPSAIRHPSTTKAEIRAPPLCATP